jgi:two-component system, OmpR family, alkaline phosphatase synthesis response regulator PhoP
MAKKHIFVVEDEEDILDLIRHHLTKEGYAVSTATNGLDALRGIARKPPDLVLLDLMLPGMDGMDVCRRLKQDPKTAEVPVLMVTAKDEESDVVSGLELGADDYVVKPFRMKELVARVRAALRRKRPTTESGEGPVRAGCVEIHPGRHEVLVAGKPVEMTFSELRILHLLASRPGWVLTRDQIVNAVRGEDYAVTDRAVDVQIVGIRRKLGAHADWIETVRGVGYRFREDA